MDPNEQLLIDKYSPRLDSLIQEQVLSAMGSEKSWQYLSLRQNDLFLKGEQYITPQLTAGVADWQSVSRTLGDDDDVPYGYVINIYKGDYRKFTAVLGQRAPNVQASPRTKSNESQTRIAKKAQVAADYLRACWDAEKAQRRLAASLAKAGTSFIYTYYNTSKDTYGSTSIPNFQSTNIQIAEESLECKNCGIVAQGPDIPAILQPPTPDGQPGIGICPNCMKEAPVFPAQTESIDMEDGTFTEYANGGCEIHICNGLTVSTPFNFSRLKEVPFLLYEYEEDNGKLMQSHPQLRGKLAGLGARRDPMGQEVRDISASLSGTSSTLFRSNSLYSRLWIRPCMYEYLFEPSTDNGGELYNLLKSQYPTGLLITRVGDIFVGLRHESIDEVWVECQPEEGDYLWREGYLNDMIECNKIINDMLSLGIEVVERSVPLNVADPKILDPQTVRSKGRKPAEFIFAKKNYTGSFKDAIHRLEVAKADPQIIQIATTILNIFRESVTGMHPSMFGGLIGGKRQTAREVQLNRDQSMMVLTTPWNNMRSAWAQAYQNGVRQLAKYSTGKLYLPDADDNEPAAEIEGIEELLGGGYIFTAEESMPMTPGEAKAYITEMMQNPNPDVLNLLGMFHPSNIPTISATIGFADWTIPMEQDRARLLDIVDKLLQETPIEGPNMYTGMIEPQSSIAPEPFLFQPGFAMDVIRAWLVSEEGREMEETNTPGYINVLLYGKGYEQIANPPLPPPLPGEEGKGGEGDQEPAPGEQQPAEAQPPPGPSAGPVPV